MQPDEVLLPYQKKWLEDSCALRIWEKCRRAGASFVLALEAVLDGSQATGTNTYYLSYNKDMTRQFIKDASFWANMINIAAQSFEEHLLDPYGNDVTVFRLSLSSGFEVAALPSVEYALRSKQGNVVLDEAAFVDDFEGIKKAAMALLMWGGKFSILSTHNGDDNPFNLFLKRIKNGDEPDWSLHHTTFKQAIDDGLYRKICQRQKKEWTREGETKFVTYIRRIYKDNAEEELDCIPVRSGSKYFPRSILDPCSESGIPVIRKGFEDDFVRAPKEKRERTVQKWFDQEVLPAISSITNPCFIGEDFARDGDLTVFWLTEEIEKKSGRTAAVIELRNWPFDQQWQFWKLLVGSLISFSGSALDARGNGQMIAEKAETEWPGMSISVMISRGWYGEWFPKLKSRLEDRDFTLPADEHLLGDFGVVQIKAGYPLIADHTGPTKAKRHGDGAVAALMSLYAMSELSDDTPPFAEVTAHSHDTVWPGY